jgi:hypothetical protein
MGIGAQNFSSGLSTFAQGGRINFQDHVSNLAFGETFNRPTAQFNVPEFSRSTRNDQFGGAGAQSRGPAVNPRADRKAAMRDAQNMMIFQDQLSARQEGRQLNAQRVARRNAGRADRARGGSLARALQAQNINSPRGIEETANIGNIVGFDRSNQGLNQVGRLIAQMGSTAAQSAGRQRLQTGGEVQEPLVSAPGEIPGPAVPPDQVPILASGGEGIVPPDIMGALDDPRSQTPEGAMAIVESLRDIMNFAPGPRGPDQFGGRPPGEISEGASPGPPRGQTGMRIPTGQERDFSQVGQGPTSFGNIPGATVQSPEGGGVPQFSLASAPEEEVDPMAAQLQQIQSAQEDIQNRIQMARARVDNFRALAIKDGNRDTQLRRELLPQAQQDLDALILEGSQIGQLFNQAVDVQGRNLSGQAQMQNAETAVERIQIGADAQVGAAQARNDFGGAPAAPATPEAQQAQLQLQQQEQTAQALIQQFQQTQDPQAAAQLFQMGIITEEQIEQLHTSNPELANAIIGQIALLQ